jgi:hypothetical protein
MPCSVHDQMSAPAERKLCALPTVQTVLHSLTQSRYCRALNARSCYYVVVSSLYDAATAAVQVRRLRQCATSATASRSCHHDTTLA